jgi:hypothetical protein
VDAIAVVEKFDRGGLGFVGKGSGFAEKQHTVDLNQFIPHHQDFSWLIYGKTDKFTDFRMEIARVRR